MIEQLHYHGLVTRAGVAYERSMIPRLRRPEYKSEPSRWRGGAKQYQISAIPLNKMREINEKIQVVVHSRMVTECEATVYTSARFRYLLQVLPMVIPVSFVPRTWLPHIHRRLSRRCG